MTPLPGWRQRDSFPASMATSAVSPGAHVGAGAGRKRKKFERVEGTAGGPGGSPPTEGKGVNQQ